MRTAIFPARFDQLDTIRGFATQAARDALDAISYEPPTRMSSTDDYTGERIVAAPTAWLRDSGRYLTPTGAGDLVYAAGLTIRNWFALHYVLATLLLTGFALLAWINGLVEADVEEWLMAGWVGFSCKRWRGIIGKIWSMAQTSGSDWNRLNFP